jgi:CubicO group peptidase (beta-lactamase class C family)
VASSAIEGICESRFLGVREAFAENFAWHGEVGAAVAVTIDGRPVVDLWAGHANAARTRPWVRDTIVNIASATKGPTAICAHRLADRRLDRLRRPRRPYRLRVHHEPDAAGDAAGPSRDTHDRRAVCITVTGNVSLIPAKA